VAAVAFNNPELELQQFLSKQPSWRRKWLQVETGTLSAEEIQEWLGGHSQADMLARSEYETILKRIPAKWRDYRRKWERIAQSGVPSGLSGRPRMDALAEEAGSLHRAGKSYAEIAIMLGEKYEITTKKGSRRPTAQSIRKLLKSRECDSQAEET